MTRRLIPTILCLLALSACSTKHYRRSADNEVGKIIADKTPGVPNMDPKFTIEATNQLTLTNLPVFNESVDFLGAESESEKGARVLSLEEALDIAVKHSRKYQSDKELLYLDALELTLERHRYTPIFSGKVQTGYARTVNEAKKGVDDIVDKQETFVGAENLGFDMLFRSGARIATDFSTDFLRFATGDPTVTTSSRLVGRLTQPLLQGAGFKIATERLTQSERDVLYSLRKFTRTRKEFSVSVATDFYTVLQNRDTVYNSWRGLQNFRKNVARERAMAEEGLRSQASLDQIKQAELQTESRWVNAVRRYRQSLDEFKISIGLHADDHVILLDRDLAELKVAHPTLGIDDAVKVAMVSRLDLQTSRDELEDAERHVAVAKNGLLPEINLIAGVDVTGNRRESFPSPDWRQRHWSVGVEAAAPFDRKAERNEYRRKLIEYERAKRELDLAVDNIKLQIADDWRNLDQAKRNYEISKLGVEIARRRVEEQQLRQELGRGTARDLIDAQNDLIDSENQLTAALVGHTTARLRFYRDMGILWVKDNGQWEEDPKHQ